jgi:predicted NAD/FAD-dependent oxidoreductase
MKIAIVGAGLAGLRLANRLRDTGAEVRVFEKARGPSGRLATRRTVEGQFDHGAQYFTARTPSFVDQVDDWCRRGVVEEWKGTIASLQNGVVSTEKAPPVRYVGVPRMSAIARDLAEDIPTEFSVRVESVHREGESWTLVTDGGVDRRGFDAVFIAVPAPQAAPLLAASPSLARRASEVRMLPCHALMLRFESDIEVEFDAAFVRSSPLAWIARNGSKPGREEEPTWVLHSSAAWSESHLNLGPEEVRDVLLAGLRAALGKSVSGVRFFAVHRWLYARPTEYSAETPLWDRGLGLGACGDWTHGDRVEDAYVSAEALADAIGVA